jgi:LacI family transcriptional regulator
MSNIKDVAKRAKVSVATVSHVLNNTRFVSEKLKIKVMKTIEKLDYEPNIMARSLRLKSTGTVGLIMPDSSNILFAEISKVIEGILFSLNYNTMFCNSGYDSKKELEIIKTFRSKRVDGIIIVPVDKSNININKLAASDIPTIILDRKIPGTDLSTITVDNEFGVYEATKYLISLGHKKIGYINRKSPHSHSIDRLKGYKKALKDSGIEIKNNLIIKGGFNYKDGYDTMEILLKNKLAFTAIITFNDTAAIGAVRAILDSGLEIPGDISVIGFDDVPICQYYNPRLTSIHYPINEISEAVTSILIKLIQKNQPKSFQNIVIAPKLIIRESTGPVRKEISG